MSKSIGKLKDDNGLTQRQRALVEYLVTEGGTYQEAGEAAGYATGVSSRNQASRALALPHVQAYMMKRIGETIGMKAGAALATVSRLSAGARSEYVQLQASTDLLDRAGFKPVERQQVQIAGDIKVSIDLT